MPANQHVSMFLVLGDTRLLEFSILSHNCLKVLLLMTNLLTSEGKVKMLGRESIHAIVLRVFSVAIFMTAILIFVVKDCVIVNFHQC